jgi:hypothetical protein
MAANILQGQSEPSPAQIGSTWAIGERIPAKIQIHKKRSNPPAGVGKENQRITKESSWIFFLGEFFLQSRSAQSCGRLAGKGCPIDGFFDKSGED